MGQRTYAKGYCPYGCGEIITTSGLGSTSHYRKHVRDGYLVEKRSHIGRCFYYTRTDKKFSEHAKGCYCIPCAVKRKTTMNHFVFGKIDIHSIEFHGRVVIKILVDDKIQPFYKSSGRNSGKPGIWFPFDGVDVDACWFKKDRYIKAGASEEDLRLHRYGNNKLLEISRALNKIDIISTSEVYTLADVNQYLFGSPDIDYDKLANIIEEYK